MPCLGAGSDRESPVVHVYFMCRLTTETFTPHKSDPWFSLVKIDSASFGAFTFLNLVQIERKSPTVPTQQGVKALKKGVLSSSFGAQAIFFVFVWKC